jgi:hypothetical protein
MADIRRIPFSEMTERVQKELIRDNSASEDKYKGRVNDVYTIDLPSLIDWRHIRTEASITTTADYNTGYISATSTTTVTGASTVWTSANSNNLLLKVSGYDEVYRCTYSAATSLTIDRSWVGTNISSNTTYSIFQDRYALASDFDRLVLDPDKSIYYWLGGIRVYLKYRDPDVFEVKQVYTPNIPAYYTIKWISGDPYIFIDPPDTSARTFFYVYMPILKRMSEYTTGYITTLANAGTAVTGSGTDFDGFVTSTTDYDYYLRIDPDGTSSASKWYKVSSAASDTALTLSDAYAGTAISGGTSTTGAYTISMISKLPAGLDLAIIYGTAIVSAIDQTNRTQIEGWSAVYTKILDQYRAVEGKLGYSKQRVHTIYERSGCRR